jgi:hypothetical protein
MSILNKLASAKGSRSENSNIILAKELVNQGSRERIDKIVENLWNRDKIIQGDCISVMEQIGLLEPKLIAPYVSDYLKLLSSKNNRMIWGAMIVLAIVADLKSDEIFKNIKLVIETTQKGSVITHDNGIRVLARVASANEEYNQRLFPILVKELQSCRPKSVPLFAKTIFISVNSGNKGQFIDVLEHRLNDLSANQQKRVKKILKEFTTSGN